MPIPIFVQMGLAVCEKMKIIDKDGQKIVMRFCKIYNPRKIADIVEHAKKYLWWEKNPKAAFMKAIGEINKKEKLS